MTSTSLSPESGTTRNRTSSLLDWSLEPQTRRRDKEMRKVGAPALRSAHFPVEPWQARPLRPAAAASKSAQDRAWHRQRLLASPPAGPWVAQDAAGGGLPSPHPGQAAESRCQAGGEASCGEPPPATPSRASWRVQGDQPTSLAPVQCGQLTADSRHPGNLGPRSISRGLWACFSQITGAYASCPRPLPSCPIPAGNSQPLRTTRGL